MSKGVVELRGLNAELRASSDDGQRRLAGYAALFGTETPISGPFSAGGGFIEKIDARAFNACLGSNPDVRCLAQHDPSQILGRTRSGTLKLRADNVGLHYVVVLPPSSLGDNIYQAVKRGDISGSSFGFACRKDSWDDSNPPKKRTLLDCDLFDVGPVSFPATSQTSVAVRSISGSTEMVKIAWYRTGKLHLPLTSEAECRAKAKALRQEMGGGADAEDDADECTCTCEACQDGNCEGCSCDTTDCLGLNCASDGSENCNCAETRQIAGKMRPAQGRTLTPVDRIQLMEDKLLAEKIWLAKKGWLR